jgi:hypothetical protein
MQAYLKKQNLDGSDAVLPGVNKLDFRQIITGQGLYRDPMILTVENGFPEFIPVLLEDLSKGAQLKRTPGRQCNGYELDRFLQIPHPPPIPLYTTIPLSRTMKASLEAFTKIITSCFCAEVALTTYTTIPQEIQSGDSSPFSDNWQLIVALRRILPPLNHQAYLCLLKRIHDSCLFKFTPLHRNTLEWDPESNSHDDNNNNSTHSGNSAIVDSLDLR